jgi:predicted nucleic acid-binding protein
LSPVTIVLDTFPLSSTAKRVPAQGADPTVLDECHTWIRNRIAAGDRVVVPAIAYYETLRELERLGATAQIGRLRTFCRAVSGRYLPLTDADLELAAVLWARARNSGKTTASPDALDGDVILAAQVLNLALPPSDVVVATTNVDHLSLFVPAKHWTLCR